MFGILLASLLPSKSVGDLIGSDDVGSLTYLPDKRKVERSRRLERAKTLASGCRHVLEGG